MSADPDFVVFPRQPFYEWLGSIALPPGSGAPGDTDCAEIVARLLDWVDANDLSDVIAAPPHHPLRETP